MTEAEWLACADPRPMLGHLRGRVSARKLRLLTCACCRRVWDLLGDERSRQAVEVAERFTDGAADAEELRAAQRGAQAAYRLAARRHGPTAFRLWLAACLAADATARRATFDPAKEFFRGAADRKERAERKARAALCRDLFGNPFRPVALDRRWLTGGDGAARKLARVIYAERRFGDLSVLADALEDAGCADAAVLAHCRGPGEHVRGCWVVDLLLGKS
jgi:hypothetical protein